MGNAFSFTRFIFELNLKRKKRCIKKIYKRLYGSHKIYNRLQNSACELNHNDYVFLNAPFEEKEIPCDFKIVNLICHQKFLCHHTCVIVTQHVYC